MNIKLCEIWHLFWMMLNIQWWAMYSIICMTRFGIISNDTPFSICPTIKSDIKLHSIILYKILCTSNYINYGREQRAILSRKDTHHTFNYSLDSHLWHLWPAEIRKSLIRGNNRSQDFVGHRNCCNCSRCMRIAPHFRQSPHTHHSLVDYSHLRLRLNS